MILKQLIVGSRLRSRRSKVEHELLRSAEIGVDRARILADRTRLIAPFDGLVTARNQDTGAILIPTKTQAILRLARTDRMRLVILVPAQTAARIRPGMRVSFDVLTLSRASNLGRVLANRPELPMISFWARVPWALNWSEAHYGVSARGFTEESHVHRPDRGPVPGRIQRSGHSRLGHVLRHPPGHPYRGEGHFVDADPVFRPWAIFCTLSGYLADRYSKTVSLVAWKFSEIVISLVALTGFLLGATDVRAQHRGLDRHVDGLSDGHARRILLAGQVRGHAGDPAAARSLARQRHPRIDHFPGQHPRHRHGRAAVVLVPRPGILDRRGAAGAVGDRRGGQHDDRPAARGQPEPGPSRATCSSRSSRTWACCFAHGPWRWPCWASPSSCS